MAQATEVSAQQAEIAVAEMMLKSGKRDEAIALLKAVRAKAKDTKVIADTNALMTKAATTYFDLFLDQLRASWIYSLFVGTALFALLWSAASILRWMWRKLTARKGFGGKAQPRWHFGGFDDPEKTGTSELVRRSASRAARGSAAAVDAIAAAFAADRE